MKKRILIGALEAAERRRKLDRVLAAVETDPEEARRRDLRRNATHIGADPRITGGAGGKTIFFAVSHSWVAVDAPPNR